MKKFTLIIAAVVAVGLPTIGLATESQNAKTFTDVIKAARMVEARQNGVLVTDESPIGPGSPSSDAFCVHAAGKGLGINAIKEFPAPRRAAPAQSAGQAS
ncbi:MAG TPA: hypothetical protein VM598_12015 [Bdellovibrionota bacterium]|jgi:hypothetical protein|nr:hypothetical protein [Bdellovibrionota bacterium]